MYTSLHVACMLARVDACVDLKSTSVEAEDCFLRIFRRERREKPLRMSLLHAPRLKILIQTT